MKEDSANSGSSKNRVRGNFLKLLSGRGVSSVLSLVATALMARSLEPAQFGLVILIHTYLLVMQGLSKISSFDAIIKYGVPAQDNDDKPRLAQLLRITFVLDCIAALAAALIACAISPLVGWRLNWADPTTKLTAVYSLLLLSSLTGSASGVLRLYDRYDLLARQQMVGALIRLIGVGFAWWQGMNSVEPFLFAWGAGLLGQNLYLLHAGWKEHQRNLSDQPIRGEVWHRHNQRFPGIWRFLNVVYWQSNLDLLPKHISVLAAGFFLGPAMAGLFRLALQFSRVLAAPALLLRQVLLPDLARLWHRRDPQFERMLRGALIVSTGSGLLIAVLSWFFAPPFLNLVAGSKYIAAAPAMHWLMLAAGLEMGIAALRAAGYAMEKAGSILKLYALSLVIYIIVFPVLTKSQGLAGAGMASAVTSFLTLMLMTLFVKKQLRDAEST